MTNVTSIGNNKRTPADVLHELHLVPLDILRISVVYTVREADGTERIETDWSTQPFSEAVYASVVLQSDVMHEAKK